MSLWVKINLIIHFLFCMLIIIANIKVDKTGDGFSFSLLKTIFSFANLGVLIIFLIGSIIWVLSWNLWGFFEPRYKKLEHTSQSTFQYYAFKNLIVFAKQISLWLVSSRRGL